VIVALQWRAEYEKQHLRGNQVVSQLMRIINLASNFPPNMEGQVLKLAPLYILRMLSLPCVRVIAYPFIFVKINNQG
jgi:hypothetical protein